MDLKFSSKLTCCTCVQWWHAYVLTEPHLNFQLSPLWYVCRSPNWNEPHIGMGTPRFGILTYPYPYRYGESPYQYGDCPFFAFFSHAQDQPFLTKQTTTQQTLLQRSPFLMRGMRRGAPRSSRRALTPRCPPTRPKRRGSGFGRGGGRGRGRLGDLPAPAGARRRRRRRRRRRS
jgi:hypothetical protein